MDRDDQEIQEVRDRTDAAISNAGGQRGLNRRCLYAFSVAVALWWVAPPVITPVKWHTGIDYANDAFLGAFILKAAIVLQTYIARRLTPFYITIPIAVRVFLERRVPRRAQEILF